MDMLRTQSIYFYFISERQYSKKDKTDKKREVNNSTQVPSPYVWTGEEHLIEQQCLFSTADARCWCYISHNGTTVMYSVCTRGFLCHTVTTTKPRFCPFPTFFSVLTHLCRLGTQPCCRGCSASSPTDGQAWP